jgi:hypothetical protein
MSFHSLVLADARTKSRLAFRKCTWQGTGKSIGSNLSSQAGEITVAETKISVIHGTISTDHIT